MNSNRIAFALILSIVIVVFAASIIRINYASALTDASSTEATTTEPAPDTTDAETPTSPETTNTETSPSTPSAQSLTLVHHVGMKYVDYCTDGSTLTAFPGNPDIDANFDKPDAPQPTCPAGQTWHHTTSMPAYDTASGDLQVGQYALVDGAFVAHYPAKTYTDATSTTEWPDRVVTGLATDPVTGEAAPISEPATTDAASTPETDTASTSIDAAPSTGTLLGTSTVPDDATPPTADTPPEQSQDVASSPDAASTPESTPTP